MNPHRPIATVGLLFVLLAACAQVQAAEPLDLSKAVLVAPQNDQTPKAQRKAAQMLVEEVEKRTGIRLNRVDESAGNVPAIYLGDIQAIPAPKQPNGQPGRRSPIRPESFVIHASRDGVTCVGDDSRGVLFAAGRLLRELRMSPGKITLDSAFEIKSAPQAPLRGHQLGYRPKTNSYDAWSAPMWDQYIRDLVVFGNNAVELIPPRSDDDDDSPHFPLPKIDMMVEMSRICDEYDQDVWIWYPAMDKDYADPATVDFALKEWAEVFQKLPRINAIFVPGGDPGHTHPKPLMALLEKQAASLKKFHPKAQMWMSPQSFSNEWMDIFIKDLQRDQPDWLAGIVFGPQVWMPLPKLRELVPAKYPIRDYPDITHSRHSQYPVPDWDLAYALTIGREGVNPRPVDEANIYRQTYKSTNGFITYSEGCNDDVNKFVWSSVGWNTDTPVIEILRQYSRYFIGPDVEEGFAQGLLSLERNWRGPLLANSGVYTTLEQFQDMERAASPTRMENWRFQQAVYRAYYDAYVRSRLIHETDLEDQALAILRHGSKPGAMEAIDSANKVLMQAVEAPRSQDWRKRVVELADALNKSIRMQLSV
ncbi:MAG: hypothetical protein U0992_13440 [Planctomycetaceae bacterium]